jgi:4-hydroxy-3-polyprenylbenzoate decarboxylase
MATAAAKAPLKATTSPAPAGDGALDAVPAHWDDLAGFVRYLEQRGELRRITQELDPVLEISALAQLAVRAGGPALLFERVKGSRYPLLINTYATRRRVSWALGVPDLDEHARAIFDLVRSPPPRPRRSATPPARRWWRPTSTSGSCRS